MSVRYEEWAAASRDQPVGSLEGVIYELVLKKFYEAGVTENDLVKGVRLTRWDNMRGNAISYTLELQRAVS